MCGAIMDIKDRRYYVNGIALALTLAHVHMCIAHVCIQVVNDSITVTISANGLHFTLCCKK